MILVGVGSLFPPPIWKTENEHGWQVVHSASAAAIFIGWYFVSTTPRWLPTASAAAVTGTSTTMESTAEPLNTVWPRRSCHAETESITIAPVTSEARTTCRYPQMKTWLVNSAPIESSCGRPVWLLVA